MPHLETLAAAERALYDTAVAHSHHRRVELHVTTLDGDPVTSLTDAFMGGSVQGDAARVPVEIVECDILDDAFELDWMSGQYRHYLVRVVDSRFVPALNDWVDADAFTGQIHDFSRQGVVVSLTIHGAEVLATGSVRQVFTRPRKSRATDVITDLLQAAGANSGNLSIPKLKATLPERVTVGVKRGKKSKHDDRKHQKTHAPKRRLFRADTEDTYWDEASKIAEALDRDLFADGSLRFCLRAHTKRPVVAFDDDTLLGPPTQQKPDTGEQFNTWLVVGADPKGPKGQVQVEVSLPARHPLSPEKLAWHGKPHQVIERTENKHLHSDKAARKVAQRKRDAALRETVEYQAEALPIVPRLRPGALVSLPTGFGRVSSRVRQWTIPLGPDADPMTIGTNVRRKATKR